MKIYYNSIDYTIPSKVSTENNCETTRKQHDVLLANLDATFDSYQLHILCTHPDISSKHELTFILNY